MKKKYIIKTLLKDFQASTLPPIITRDYQIPIGSGKIITLIGARRSGQSFLLYQLVKQLTAQVNDLAPLVTQ